MASPIPVFRGGEIVEAARVFDPAHEVLKKERSLSFAAWTD
jgi:hypothetical protein